MVSRLTSMNKNKDRIQQLYNSLLGEDADEKLRTVVLFSAVTGFLGHLALWFFCWMGNIELNEEAGSILRSPLSALYTPFSILLAYEVYELIRAIPSSFSSAVGKQYEVVTLLVVRDIFKRLSNIEFSGEWSISAELTMIIFECFTFSLLFYTALRYRSHGNESHKSAVNNEQLKKFVRAKHMIALMLFFTFFLVASASLTTWIASVGQGEGSVGRDIFFLDFFTFLILADILILLFSYRYSVDFANLARNTGFVLSTVILRVAIGAPGISSLVLFTLSGIMGLTIIRMTEHFHSHNRPSEVSEQQEKEDKNPL